MAGPSLDKWSIQQNPFRGSEKHREDRGKPALCQITFDG